MGVARIRDEGEANGNPGFGNELSINFEIDQTFLPPLIGDLGAVSREFPLGERPPAMEPRRDG
jgi:hypothetical protein